MRTNYERQQSTEDNKTAAFRFTGKWSEMSVTSWHISHFAVSSISARFRIEGLLDLSNMRAWLHVARDGRWYASYPPTKLTLSCFCCFVTFACCVRSRKFFSKHVRSCYAFYPRKNPTPFRQPAIVAIPSTTCPDVFHELCVAGSLCSLCSRTNCKQVGFSCSAASCVQCA